MKKNWKLLIAVCAGFMILSGSVLASPGLRIYIDNSEFAGSAFKLKMDNGTAMVSLRSIVEQFRGKLIYKDNSIYVTMPEAAHLSNQNRSLENALRAESPEEAVQTWIRGVQKRSGALQYAVLSPTLRQKTVDEFEENFWVTGGSSPHMGKVDKLIAKEITSDKVQLSFDYPLVVMNEVIESGHATIVVEKIKQESFDYWAITDIILKDPGDTGLMIGANSESEANRIPYENTKYTFTLKLPQSWEGKYEVKERISAKGNNFDFINKATKYGILFTISIWDKQSWISSEEEIRGQIPITELGEKGDVVYLFHTPTDVQYDPSDDKSTADYQSMFNDVKTIIKSFEIKKK
ncbi:hypothetical protein FHS15_000600 [Paenibacillus castaneae]|uniref:hypothetical protein n=1 Tax=Paenibacillus castaneae TaxID=474957 RepID=UPI000C9C83C5|nr:hypothetical protein [Paenibacillus castaneae]NIK75500.1 hypothetical protein [Paenibacillus castaneae]